MPLDADARSRLSYRLGVLVLLPPSESKTGRSRGKPLDLGRLSFPTLTAHRQQVLDAVPPFVVTVEHGAGRVVVLADSDLVGDDSIGELDHEEFWVNLVRWAGNGARGLEGSGLEAQAAGGLRASTITGPW